MNSLWYYKDPTEYLDWMVSLSVDRLSLDPHFLLPVGFGEWQKLKLLREAWVR